MRRAKRVAGVAQKDSSSVAVVRASKIAACPFCNNPDEVIASNRYAYVIHDKHPYVEGHLLVIPKKHYENIMEMDAKSLCGTIELAKEMEKRLVERLHVKGITIRQNWAPFLEESHLVVRHVHFHLIPRSLDDGLYYKVGRISIPPERRKEIIRSLK
ncbi:MAG: HIT family protein [Candidatus Micrarchaeia archaeon]